MKKYIYTIIIMSLMVLNIQAQGINVARTFCENIRLYTLTNAEEYRDSIENLFDPQKRARIANALALTLAPRYNYPRNTSYLMDTYLNLLLHASKDSIHVEFYDFEKIDERQIVDTSRQQPSDVEYITYRLKLSGSLYFETQDLMVIREGKISLITQFQKFN